MSAKIDEMIGELLAAHAVDGGVALPFVGDVPACGLLRSKAEMRTLDSDAAASVIRRFFFTAPHIDTLPVPLHPLLLNQALSYGPQKAIGRLQHTILCEPTGRIDDLTRSVLDAAIKRIGLKHVTNRIINTSIAACEALVASTPALACHLDEWIKNENSWRMQ